jgi:hypothetical protein
VHIEHTNYTIPITLLGVLAPVSFLQGPSHIKNRINLILQIISFICLIIFISLEEHLIVNTFFFNMWNKHLVIKGRTG